MSQNSANNKRIAQNTILLYFRMIVTLIVGLFTSRVILDSLGVEDYGIYNLVGGFVSMFSVVRAGLVSSTQRFITYDLGSGNFENLKKTFSTVCVIYLCLCAIVLLFAELGGIWFLDSKLSIPSSRLTAAHWVFHLSLITLVVTLLSSPYNSLIIAHEKMKAFAYITIYEVVAKLIVAYLIYVAPFDKLITYAILLCFVQITVPILYWIYCKHNFKESTICFKFDWPKIKEIYAFAGWSMMGGLAFMGFTQGLNMLLGMFFTPVVNAARGIAVQVQGIILQFVSNFQTAIDPQIIKSYARGDRAYMNQLISTSSRFSFYLLYLLSLPIILEAEELLGWWLVEVPDYTAFFFRLIIITTMFDAISNPYGKAIQATGMIKNYQLVTSSILLLIVPVAYLVLRLGGDPYSVFVVHIVLGFIAMCSRIYMAQRIADIPVVHFVSGIIRPVIMVTALSFIIPLFAHILMPEGFIRFMVVSLLSVVCSILAIYNVGLRKEEIELVKCKISSVINNIRQ